ncbi:hypothetical protein H9L39_10590 [Fusarium oxysporum f. sp. albedinis]|nr:hypothetical protein H9L39_10590 [Fusarium oxysporum f. sp. albedinis]
MFEAHVSASSWSYANFALVRSLNSGTCQMLSILACGAVASNLILFSPYPAQTSYTDGFERDSTGQRKRYST